MDDRKGVRWLAWLAAAGCVLTGAWVGHGMGRRSVQDRFARHCAAQIAALPAAAAAGMLESLPEEPWALAVRCAALSDPRREVRVQAAQQVERIFDRWRQLPLADASPHVVQLAACLAQQAPRLPLDQRPWLRRMAQRLLEQPLDAATTEPAALIAHCQSILLLPEEPPADEPLVLSGRPETSANPAQQRSSTPGPSTVAPVPTTAPPAFAEDAPLLPSSSTTGHAARTSPEAAEPRPLVDATARPLVPPLAHPNDPGPPRAHQRR